LPVWPGKASAWSSACQLFSIKPTVPWDAPTRWFHWINALTVIGLIATGLIILNDDALGLSGSGTILLKSIHVSIGYLMGINLVWRFVWPSLVTGIHVGEVFYPAGPGIWQAYALIPSRSSPASAMFTGNKVLTRRPPDAA
jgi:Ni/Fe-hydrogenase 1 B-type cytochrome subunit